MSEQSIARARDEGFVEVIEGLIDRGRSDVLDDPAIADKYEQAKRRGAEAMGQVIYLPFVEQGVSLS